MVYRENERRSRHTDTHTHTQAPTHPRTAADPVLATTMQKAIRQRNLRRGNCIFRERLQEPAVPEERLLQLPR
eukprot:6545182-Alexandrium_andersonii.AAC.1